jgi:hypothetical protein
MTPHQAPQTHGPVQCYMRPDLFLELYTMCGPYCPSVNKF